MDEFKVLRKMALWGFLFIAVLVASLGGCAYANRQLNLENDNMIEQSIEAVIEAETGVSLDLTPED